jgi:hypothetical protein
MGDYMKKNIINKKFKRRNILNKVMFTFLCMFILVFVVQGETIGSGQKWSESQARSEAAKNSSSASANDNNLTRGIRISILTSTGEQLFSNDYLQAVSSAYTNYSNSPCSRASNCGGYSSSWTYHSGLSNISELQNIFDSNGISVDVYSLIVNENISKYDLFSDLLNSKDNDKAKAFFSSFGINPDDYYDASNQSYDLFLTWEPLGEFNFTTYSKTSKYVGTAYELLTFINNNSKVKYVGENDYHQVEDEECVNVDNGVGILYGTSEKCTEYYWTYTEHDGWWGFGKGYTNMACNVVLDDSDDFGNKVSEKFSSFSSRSYFGGNLNASDAGSVASNCSAGGNTGSTLKSNVLDSSTSLGIGILWFDDIANPVNEITCSAVNSYYGGQTILNNAVLSGTANFSSFNSNWLSTYGSYPTNLPNGVTTDWYKANCATTPTTTPGTTIEPQKYNCTPSLNVSNCSNTSLSYKDVGELKIADTNYWQNCVFNDDGRYEISTHKSSSSSSSLTYRESSLGSEYCEVYCTESVDAIFDSSTPTVLAGSTFSWGWGRVNSTRTCKTKSIDWGNFTQDLLNADQLVLDTYAAYLLQQEINSEGSGYWVKVDDDINEYETSDCAPNGTYIDPITGPICITYEKEQEDVGDICEWQGSTDKSISGQYLYPFGQLTGSASINPGRVTTDNGGCGSIGVPSVGNTNYESAIASVNNVINNMKKCYNFEDSNVLNDQSSAKLTYSGNKYTYSGEMSKSTSSNYSDDKSACTTYTVMALTNCTGNNCYGVQNVDNCTSYTKTGSSTSVFSPESGIYQYVLKTKEGLNLTSVHSWELNNYRNSNFTLNYINIGYSNFPVAFNTDAKTYDDDLKIEYSNLGHKSSTQNKTAVDTVLSSNNSSNQYGTWSCDYTVSNDLIPNDSSSNKNCTGSNCGNGGSGNNGSGDINVIYREIDLYHPFPDIDSSNRATGANWCDTSSCAWNNSTSTSYILNNRNVTGDAVYDLTPMYTFIMTPSDIIKIRKYNNSNTYSSYTGSYSGKYYDFKCEEGTGRKCISEYLTELMNMMDSYSLPGSCTSDKARNNSANSEFDICRYRG